MVGRNELPIVSEANEWSQPGCDSEVLSFSDVIAGRLLDRESNSNERMGRTHRGRSNRRRAARVGWPAIQSGGGFQGSAVRALQ